MCPTSSNSAAYFDVVQKCAKRLMDYALQIWSTYKQLPGIAAEYAVVSVQAVILGMEAGMSIEEKEEWNKTVPGDVPSSKKMEKYNALLQTAKSKHMTAWLNGELDLEFKCPKWMISSTVRKHLQKIVQETDAIVQKHTATSNAVPQVVFTPRSLNSGVGVGVVGGGGGGGGGGGAGGAGAGAGAGASAGAGAGAGGAHANKTLVQRLKRRKIEAERKSKADKGGLGGPPPDICEVLNRSEVRLARQFELKEASDAKWRATNECNRKCDRAHDAFNRSATQYSMMQQVEVSRCHGCERHDLSKIMADCSDRLKAIYAMCERREVRCLSPFSPPSSFFSLLSSLFSLLSSLFSLSLSHKNSHVN